MINADLHLARLLGAAQLLVFAASFVSERLLEGVVGSAGGSDILIAVSNHLSRIRLSILIALLNSAFIIVLGCLFYAVFREQYSVIALIALACFLAEGITLAVSRLGAYALIPLSREFTQAGAQGSSTYSTLADTLYIGIDRRGYDLHMLFFCLGGSLWYYLLLVSGAVPQALAIWGLAAIILLTIPVLMVLYDNALNSLMFLGIFYLPFEVVLGIWLLVRGFQ
jgi:hypothetical protein